MPPTAAAAAPAKPAPYVMPEVNPGDVVLWSQNPRSEPSPAIVTKVGKEGVALTIFPPDSKGGLPRDGVRHAADPQLLRMAAPESGVWTETAATLRRRHFEAMVAADRR